MLLVILLILFFTILIFIQIYSYLYPVREGLESNSCDTKILLDLSNKITRLESQVDNFHLGAIQKTIMDLCGNVSILLEQQNQQANQLTNQANSTQNVSS